MVKRLLSREGIHGSPAEGSRIELLALRDLRVVEEIATYPIMPIATGQSGLLKARVFPLAQAAGQTARQVAAIATGAGKTVLFWLGDLRETGLVKAEKREEPLPGEQRQAPFAELKTLQSTTSRHRWAAVTLGILETGLSSNLARKRAECVCFNGSKAGTTA